MSASVTLGSDPSALAATTDFDSPSANSLVRVSFANQDIANRFLSSTATDTIFGLYNVENGWKIDMVQHQTTPSTAGGIVSFVVSAVETNIGTDTRTGWTASFGPVADHDTQTDLNAITSLSNLRLQEQNYDFTTTALPVITGTGAAGLQDPDQFIVHDNGLGRTSQISASELNRWINDNLSAGDVLDAVNANAGTTARIDESLLPDISYGDTITYTEGSAVIGDFIADWSDGTNISRFSSTTVTLHGGDLILIVDSDDSNATDSYIYTGPDFAFGGAGTLSASDFHQISHGSDSISQAFADSRYGRLTDVTTNTTNITTNAGNIATNTGNISTNTTAISNIPGKSYIPVTITRTLSEIRTDIENGTNLLITFDPVDAQRFNQPDYRNAPFVLYTMTGSSPNFTYHAVNADVVGLSGNTISFSLHDANEALATTTIETASSNWTLVHGYFESSHDILLGLPDRSIPALIGGDLFSSGLLLDRPQLLSQANQQWFFHSAEISAIHTYGAVRGTTPNLSLIHI